MCPVPRLNVNVHNFNLILFLARDEDYKVQDRKKIYLLFALSVMLLLGLIIKKLSYHQEEKPLNFNVYTRQNHSFNYEYFDIIKWP